MKSSVSNCSNSSKQSLDDEIDDVWKDVDSDNGIDTADSNEVKVTYDINFNPLVYKKHRKMISLVLMILFVSFLAYLDYANDFQIKNLITNFHIFKSCSNDMNTKSTANSFGFVSSLTSEFHQQHDDPQIDLVKEESNFKIVDNLFTKIALFAKKHILKQ